MLKLRYRGRLQTDGLCFICPRVKLEIGRDATLRIGRWAWVGHGCKIRVHEGEVEIGAKTVMGQECTISAYQHVSIGRECILADRVMLIDFDHGVTEVDRPIRLQGIYKRDVRVGNNVWIGYGACVLRGVSVGDNSVVGTSAVVPKRRARERRRRWRAGAHHPYARGATRDALAVAPRPAPAHTRSSARARKLKDARRDSVPRRSRRRGLPAHARAPRGEARCARSHTARPRPV